MLLDMLMPYVLWIVIMNGTNSDTIPKVAKEPKNKRPL